MSKKTIVLVLFLSLICGLLVMVAISGNKSKQAIQQNTNSSISSSPTEKPANKQSVLYLSPNPVIVFPQTPSTFDVIVDSGTNKVTAVQLELSYDPQALGNVDITLPQTTGFFENPLTLIKDVNRAKGTITFAIGIQPSASAKLGKGIIATVSFTPLLSSGKQTSVKMLKTSLATAEGETKSVLKSVTGTTILSSTSEAPIVPSTETP